MHIFTDDVEFADTLISKKTNWKKYGISETNKSLNILCKNLYQSNTIFHTTIKSPTSWKILFIKKHAAVSQFEILRNLLHKNINLPDSILCLAGSGNNFHGFKNRKWETVSGNIHLSAFVAPDKIIQYFDVGFIILSAISVIQTLDFIPSLNQRIAIRWVNDIIIDNAKIGGVLTHTQTQGRKVTGAILGIGLNVEQTPFVESDSFVPEVCSLADFIKFDKKINLAILIERLVEKLSQNYQILHNGEYEKLHTFYVKKSMIMNKNICVYSDPESGKPQKIFEGKVINIGKNLELYFENLRSPIRKGRIQVKK